MEENLLTIPDFYPKQIEFLESKSRYNAFGGARGGGKSFVMRWKVVLMALRYTGIQILLLRRTLPELRENHLIPLQKILRTADRDKNKRLAEYRDVTKEFLFPNGSRIKLGYCDSENDVLQFQGQAYDVMCLEEATHFTYFQYQTLTESNRPSGLMKEAFKPRMYFTCNPGGVGHQWFKRLFIDRIYENNEKEEDYKFVQSLVYDNKWLLENDPDYVRTLENLPEERRNAMLYGNWDVYEGQFFGEFDRKIHVIEPRKLPERYTLYRALDYGLDMLACYHFVIDETGNVFIVSEIHEKDLIVSEAAQKIKNMTESLGFDEKEVELTLAPGDLWNRQTQTGKSAADLFYENGITLTEVSRDRVNGWLTVKEIMKVSDSRDELTGDPIKVSKLKIFSVCKNLIANLPLAQFSDKKINDMATEPHEITHSLDALRYFSVYWLNGPKKEVKPKAIKFKWTEDMIEDYYNGSDEIKKRMVTLYGEIN